MSVWTAMLIGSSIALSFLWFISGVMAQSFYWERKHQLKNSDAKTPSFWRFLKMGPLGIWAIIKDPNSLPEIK